MASAMVNNVGMGPEGFLDCCPPTAAYGWLSPRISFSRDFADEEKVPPPPARSPSKVKPVLKVKEAVGEAEGTDLDDDGKDIVLDFEFRLDDPVAMLPADELFSDGKLVPLQLAPVRSQGELPAAVATLVEVRSPEPQKLRMADINESVVCDQYVFSPKAPRCSSSWRELLGLKRAAVAAQGSKPDQKAAAAAAAAAACALPSTATSRAAATASTTRSTNPRSLKHFLHRSSKSSTSSSSTDSSSLIRPLLRDSDSESISISSRLSLSSSSSSCPDHDDLPRLSLDSDKPSTTAFSLNRQPPRLRLSTQRPCHDPSSKALPDHPPGRVRRSHARRVPDASAIPSRGASVDSPRMNSYGKVVFQGLERSSSSPSTFNGGPRAKPRGMERSYSANVRITPVLNVPVCSLRGSSRSGSVFGFGQLFSPQKRDSGHSMAATRTNTTVNSGGVACSRSSGRLWEGVLGN